MESNSHLDEIKKTVQKIKDKESEYKNNISNHNEASSIFYEANIKFKTAKLNVNEHSREHRKKSAIYKTNEIARKKSLAQLKELRAIEEETRNSSELQIELQGQLNRRYELEQTIYELHTHLINIVSKNITHQTGIKIDLSKSVKRNIQKTIAGCYDCGDVNGISSMFDEFS